MQGRSVGLTGAEAERYSRHIVLPELGPPGQRRLKGSTVAVVGVGGLGVAAAVQLVSAGVGKVTLIDYDAVSASNLQRQFIYSDANIGGKKVEAAAKRLHEVNPNVQIVPVDAKLDSSKTLEMLRGHEAVLDCTDSLPARYLINDACSILQVPDIYASASGTEGHVCLFHAETGPCYRCLFPVPPDPNSVATCEESGILSTVPGILGAVQANEAIEFLIGNGGPLLGRLITFNGSDVSFDEVKLRKNPACPACGPSKTIAKLIDYEEFCGTKSAMAPTEFDVTPEELKASLGQSSPPMVVDVREPYEYELCHIEGAKLIPLGELPRRKDELPKDTPVVVYCHVGVRSTHAVGILRSAGFKNARNLKGGIDAWAVKVDQSLKRY